MKQPQLALALGCRFIPRFAASMVLFASFPGLVCGQGHSSTFTFSRSNLLDGGLKLTAGLSTYDVLRAAEEALGLWASVAPLTFLEVPDNGPAVDDVEYSAVGLPDIRIGHHDFSGNVLAHAYSPGGSGLSSDVHLDDTARVWDESLLFTTLAHELGHALGLDHMDDQLSIMNSTLGGNNLLPAIDTGYLLPPEVEAIQSLWGHGTGEVISTRHWVGSNSSRWTDDSNWQEGWRPTGHSDVYLEQDAVSSITSGTQAIRSLTLGGGTNELRLVGSARLNVNHEVTLGRAQGGRLLVPLGATATVHVPVNSLDQPGWTQPDFDDSQWQSGPTAIGFERGEGYGSLIQTDLESQMYNRVGSVYTRLAFDISDPASLDFLQLQMQFDDGFVAYLNGTQVIAANAPRT